MSDDAPEAGKPPHRIRFAPPLDREDVPPVIASEVVVRGGADEVTLEFYHVGPTKLRQAVDGIEAAPGVVRDGEVMVIRTEPIARVALRFTVATEMLMRVIETAIASADDIQFNVGAFAATLEQLIKWYRSAGVEIGEGSATDAGSAERVARE